jgi:two-component system response regulator AtoC
VNIAVIDDEPWPAEDLSRFLETLGHIPRVYHSAKDALTGLKTNSIDLVISDVNMPEMTGIELVRQINFQKIPVECILMSGHDDVVNSINAIELGLLDFLTKPIDIRELARLIQEYEEQRSRETLVLSESGEAGLFSNQTRNLYRKLKKLQDFPQIPVLIQGETGTGKEVLARFLHHNNAKVSGPFIPLNCSALTRELFEAELFGYESGAFTGADKKGKPGKVELASDGTLFLDEITELPPDLQAKLLRVIQERSYFSVGGVQQKEVRTRIVCATNEDIEQLVKDGAFREDLFYRLSVCRVQLPPLRERKEEIIPLTWMFLRRFAGEFSHSFVDVEPRVFQMLEGYSWPGNVREMKNILTNVAIFGEGKVLTGEMILEQLGFRIEKDSNQNDKLVSQQLGKLVLPTQSDFELPEDSFDLEEFTRDIVRKTLERFQGNKTKTASFLGLTRTQLYGRYRDLVGDE